MMFNGVVMLTVAHVSAPVCQRVACIPISERVSSSQLLGPVCCFPLQQLGRLALCLWTFLCVPPVDFSIYLDSDSDSDDHDRDDGYLAIDFDGAYYYESHSD